MSQLSETPKSMSSADDREPRDPGDVTSGEGTGAPPRAGVEVRNVVAGRDAIVTIVGRSLVPLVLEFVLAVAVGLYTHLTGGEAVLVAVGAFVLTVVFSMAIIHKSFSGQVISGTIGTLLLVKGKGIGGGVVLGTTASLAAYVGATNAEQIAGQFSDRSANSEAEPVAGTLVAAATVMRPALVQVSGGTFLMGSPPTEVGRNNNETQHRVQVSSFVMCETEVTQAQFVAVAGDLPTNCRGACGDTLPAHGISWVDAADYLDGLSRKEGLRPCYSVREGANISWDRSCDGYRLPTEAEWEYAARAGTTTAYSYGDARSELCKHANGAKEKCDDGFRGLAPVGSFRASHGNPWGLLDLHGNVYEWVWDGYDTFYGMDGAQVADVNLVTTNPSGPPTPLNVRVRVMRGGSFGLSPRYLRSADRFRTNYSDRDPSFGFRCVRGTPSELWGKGSVDAGGGVSATGIKAGRDVLARVVGPGATLKDVEAGRDADVSVEQK